MGFKSIELVRSDQDAVKIRARIADEASERSAGYQHICPEIIQTSSILFVYEQPVLTSFHMFNVHAKLDIGFFDENGELIELIRMTPQSRSNSAALTYGPKEKFVYALETRAGFFSENGLKPGSAKLEFP